MEVKDKVVNGRILKEQEAIRYEKLQDLRKKGYDVYSRKFTRNYNSRLLNNTFANKSKIELALIASKATNDQIIIAGRLMLKRVMGKAIFAQLQDQDGRFQIYINEKDVTKAAFSLFIAADIGDIFGINGKIMRTNKGELTVKVYGLTILAKALHPLADK